MNHPVPIAIGSYRVPVTVHAAEESDPIKSIHKPRTNEEFLTTKSTKCTNLPDGSQGKKRIFLYFFTEKVLRGLGCATRRM